ncbi:unnamed protein product [Rotaria magnacalcarata]
MPNLTSYSAPPIHLNRELPKTYCDLIRHEIDYNDFLRKRIANIQSSLSRTNKKPLIKTANNHQRRAYFDHNQRLFYVYKRNLQLCQKILQISTKNGKQQGGVDCHNENYKKRTKISHFRLRQKHWKDTVENENKQFIRSLIYHRNKYQPIHDRRIAHQAYQQHLKLLKAMSHYPKYNITNPFYKNLLDYDYLPQHFYYNYSKAYHIDSTVSLRVRCQTLPFSYKLNRKQKPKTIQTHFDKSTRHVEEVQTNRYVENILQQTINKAIYIYNQPLPSVSNCYFATSQSFKKPPNQYQSLFRSSSCRELLEPWCNKKQHREPLRTNSINDNMINEKQRILDSYNNIQEPKQMKLINIFLCLHLARTSHFQGGTITYKIMNTNGSTVSIMITQTYIYRWPLIYCDNADILSQSSPNMSAFPEYNYKLNCISNCTTDGGYVPVPIRPYCIDYSAPMSISTTQRTDIVNITIGAYFTVAFQSSAWRTLSLPTGSPTSKGWSISCTIDLRIRSDTSKLNTPPVANIISPIAIPVGVQQSLIIQTIDSDNDVVRCRFADTPTECADVCPPSSLPNNTILISSNCTLLITGAKVHDWYAVAIQIEDFASANSTTPLSSVPVQILVNVYASPNCTITPRLYGSTNQTGTCQSLQVGQLYATMLYAENYCSNYSVTIEDIATLSFPIVIKSNLIRNTSTLYSVGLTWTPTANEIGSQILCAVAIDSQNVQSNQYCVAFAVSQNGSAACPEDVLETTASSITSTTTIRTTTDSPQSTFLWLLFLTIGFAVLLSLLCCLLCSFPNGLGSLYRKHRGEVSPEQPPNTDRTDRLPIVYMLPRRSNHDLDNISRSASSLESSRSATDSDVHLDLFSTTSRDRMNRRENNDRWAYSPPRYYQIEITRAKYSTKDNSVRFQKDLVQISSSFDEN